MKKILLSIAATLVMTAASADEGMWLLPMLQKFNSEAMRNIGCRLSPKDIYNINKASLKDAIVQFGGGCTGEVISDKGLVSTNHHCGYGSIQRLSTPEKNYLEDGFFAKRLEEEIPVPGLYVRFLKSMEDVTDELKDLAAKEYADKVGELVNAARAANPHCTASVISFYNDNVKYLIVYQTFRDVRFVGAPPASMGKFGGETDNWMWPRHTCDFSLFRIYADADNNPAEYSADNRPYKPAKSLKISLKGVKEGDFSFIMGYPGRTQRFQTADELNFMIEQNNLRVAARTVYQNAMMRGMEKDPAIRLKYANKYAGSSNGWKKWQGEDLAFKKLGIIDRELAKEAEFTRWVEQDPARKDNYGSAISDLGSCVKAGRDASLAMTLIIETFGKMEYPAKVMEVKNFNEKDFDFDTDRDIALSLTAFYAGNARDEDFVSVEGKNLDRTNIVDYVAGLYDNPDKDAMQAFMQAIGDKARDFSKVMSESNKGKAVASKAFTAGLLEWNAGKPSYPDANFTMRLTYGNVKSYSAKDGMNFWHYTTANGIIEKEDPSNYEFRVPAKVKELILKKDFGRYADRKGELITCFLTNNDITGGNSGSPVLDAKGNLIGLAFDVNWESMSSDVCFEPDLQRCICVDIRYVLWMVEKVGGATNIIDELVFVK